jgi:hypothetical protein
MPASRRRASIRAVELAFSPTAGAIQPDGARSDALELMQRIAAADTKWLILFLDEFQELATQVRGRA